MMTRQFNQPILFGILMAALLVHPAAAGDLADQQPNVGTGCVAGLKILRAATDQDSWNDRPSGDKIESTDRMGGRNTIYRGNVG